MKAWKIFNKQKPTSRFSLCSLRSFAVNFFCGFDEENRMPKVAVIVVGAGSGSRFGQGRNKIFAKVAGQAMFLRTLSAFGSRDDVCQSIFVCSQADRPEIQDQFAGHLGLMGISLVTGGQTRSQSVRNALAEVSDQAQLICVHDAARPCIAQAWIDAVFHAAAKTGAAMLALPIHGTVKRVDENNLITQTLPRDQFAGLWEAQTPQVFQRDILLAAYEADADATDDAALVEATGQAVKIVPGDGRNIKVTTPADLKFVNEVFKTLPKPAANRLAHPFREDLR